MASPTMAYLDSEGGAWTISDQTNSTARAWQARLAKDAYGRKEGTGLAFGDSLMNVQAAADVVAQTYNETKEPAEPVQIPLRTVTVSAKADPAPDGGSFFPILLFIGLLYISGKRHR